MPMQMGEHKDIYQLTCENEFSIFELIPIFIALTLPWIITLSMCTSIVIARYWEPEKKLHVKIDTINNTHISYIYPSTMHNECMSSFPTWGIMFDNKADDPLKTCFEPWHILCCAMACYEGKCRQSFV